MVKVACNYEQQQTKDIMHMKDYYTKDYYAILKVQHGPLRAAMQRHGIENARKLSMTSGVSECVVGRLLNFKMSPKRPIDGDWRKSALKLSEFFQMSPSELFPEHLQREIPTNKISNFVEQSQLTGCYYNHAPEQLTPAEELERKEDEAVMNEMLGYLSDDHQYVLKSRFWDEKTYRSTGRELGVCGQAIKLRERRALKKLRHPVILSKLVENMK
jgi:RNA polymerase sigma factor (sigma-70 family)